MVVPAWREASKKGTPSSTSSVQRLNCSSLEYGVIGSVGARGHRREQATLMAAEAAAARTDRLLRQQAAEQAAGRVAAEVADWPRRSVGRGRRAGLSRTTLEGGRSEGGRLRER